MLHWDSLSTPDLFVSFVNFPSSQMLGFSVFVASSYKLYSSFSVGIFRVHTKWIRPRFNIPSKRSFITFPLSDTQDPHPHWQRGRDPDCTPLEFEQRTFDMIDVLTTTEPRMPLQNAALKNNLCQKTELLNNTSEA